jgi:hypothetical protein
MRLDEVRDVFLSVLPEATFHNFAWSKPDQYIVWAEDGQADAVHADNQMQIQVTEGTVDLFTKTEYDPVVNQIQQAMNISDMSWYKNSTQHEEETGYIHHEWVWQVGDDVG